jgi:hypothetical protein
MNNTLENTTKPNNDCFVIIGNNGNNENTFYEDENSYTNFTNKSKFSKCTNLIKNIIGHQPFVINDTESRNV